MPNRQTKKASRLPSIAAKMSTLTGVSTSEKQLLIRIGNLVDTITVSQRNLTNPGERGPRVLSRRVPKPANMTIATANAGVDVTWDAVDFNSFQLYEVQHYPDITFADPITINAFTNKVAIKGITDETIVVRVRTVDRIGNVSEWETGSIITLATSILFSFDTDHKDYENRTRVTVSPFLSGGFASTGLVSRVLAGVGAAVGPGPVTFYDPSFGGRSGLKNQITYTLLENDVIIIQEKTMGLPILFYEVGDTTTDSNGRHYTSFSGSFLDFFNVAELIQDPSAQVVSFLDYLQTPHEQSGIVYNATLGVIKF
jgi:hypothetical protein